MKFKARDNGVGINSGGGGVRGVGEGGGAGHHECRRINSAIILYYAAFHLCCIWKTPASEVHLTVYKITVCFKTPNISMDSLQVLQKNAKNVCVVENV